MAWKEYCVECQSVKAAFGLERIMCRVPESIDRYSGCHNLNEIMLKTYTIYNNQSLKAVQVIALGPILAMLRPVTLRSRNKGKICKTFIFQIDPVYR